VKTTILSSKGQLVIPKQVRELANIAAGDAFEVLYLDGEIRLRPVAKIKNTTVDEVAGILANSRRMPPSEPQTEAAIKARLKAEDLATMRGAPKSPAS
jgi:AbrB family looped-hinge helix DNA binding protein